MNALTAVVAVWLVALRPTGFGPEHVVFAIAVALGWSAVVLLSARRAGATAAAEPRRVRVSPWRRASAWLTRPDFHRRQRPVGFVAIKPT